MVLHYAPPVPHRSSHRVTTDPQIGGDPLIGCRSYIDRIMISRACEPKTYSSMALVRSVLEWLMFSSFFQKNLQMMPVCGIMQSLKGKENEKRKSVLDFIGFILGILFLVWAFRVYSSFSPYRAPDETKFYYLQSGNNYRLMALDTESTLWDYQTYYDPQAQAMAASRACFLLSGETGRHLFGSYYLIGDSWFSARKAPYDTKPYHLNLTFVDYQSFNVTNPSYFSDGQKFTDDIYLSDEYFIRQDEIFQRIEADEIPKELVLPLIKLE